MKLEGNLVTIIPFGEKELNSSRYWEILNLYENIRYIGRPEYVRPFQFEMVQSYIQNLWQSEQDCLFALYSKSDHNLIGTFKIGHINDRCATADIGILIDHPYAGKGFGTETMQLGCDYAFRQLSLRKLTGGTFALNQGMARLFEKTGFFLEGRLRNQHLCEGVYTDHLLFGMFSHEFHYGGK